MHNFLNTRRRLSWPQLQSFFIRRRAPTVADDEGWTMRASDCSTVETPEFLLAALEQAGEAVVILNGDLRVSHFNAAAERIWGIVRAEIVGHDANRLGLTDLRPSSEISIRRQDGSRLRAALSADRGPRTRVTSSITSAGLEGRA